MNIIQHFGIITKTNFLGILKQTESVIMRKEMCKRPRGGPQRLTAGLTPCKHSNVTYNIHPLAIAFKDRGERLEPGPVDSGKRQGT